MYPLAYTYSPAQLRVYLQHQVDYMSYGINVVFLHYFPELAICVEGTLKCPSSYCIPLAYECDGTWDCVNGEDEISCGMMIAYKVCICLCLLHPVKHV